jgi:hypothetical protein
MPDKIQLEFALGCFDEFEGTQEELDQLIADLQQLADSGELFEELGISEEDLANITVGGVFDGELPDEVARMIFGDEEVEAECYDLHQRKRTLH